MEGRRPSSDTETHAEIYKHFANAGGVVHTHSPYATSWAQAGRDIPCYGTTHADYYYGAVPCLRMLTREELDEGYEKNTGVLIAGEFQRLVIDPAAVTACLCQGHGPFCWGRDGADAAQGAVVLEECAKMAYRCEQINPEVKSVPQYLLDKHYFRKHGENAYYGQQKKM